MRFLKNTSLRRKLTLIIMLTSSVVLLLACAAFVAYDVFKFRREMVESVSSLAEVVGNNTTAAIDFRDPSSAARTLAALRGEPSIVLAQVHTPDGLKFATYVREGARPPPEISHSIDTGHEFTANHLHLFRPITQAGEQIGTIELVATLDELSKRLWRYAGIAALVLAVSLLAAFGLSSRLQKLISNPILHLAQMARSVALEKNYSVRAHKQSNDELGQLVDGFNEMLGQIQQRDAALQSGRDALETRVAQRTTELAKTNEALQVENTERRRAETTLQESKLFLQSTLDALSSHIAILDEYGTIVEVNAAWRHFASENDFVGSGEGVGNNYLKVCDLVFGSFSDEAPAVASGIRAIMTGQSQEFHLEYPCHSPKEKRWFIVRATRFGGDGPVRVVVAHENITARKRAEAELELVNKQLLDVSRRGGMAEIATNVLHNVGNVLNSVNISTGLTIERVKKSKASSLARVVTLLREHEHDLGEFISNDAKGKLVPAHLALLSEHLITDQKAILKELDSLRQNVEHIKEIVSMQQSYATFGGVKEMINVVHLIEDGLRMNEGALSRHRVQVIREFEEVPPINVEKHKILQILVNLLRNAKHACQDSDRTDKKLTVRVVNGDGRIKISVSDNGIGIQPENLTRIFNHGFTTKKEGHGFGLHSGALAATEMGGSLSVQSDGAGRGATFTLELPMDAPAHKGGDANKLAA